MSLPTRPEGYASLSREEQNAWYGANVAPQMNSAEDDVLPIVSASSFAGKPIPPRSWIVPDMIPDRTVTLMSGDGGDGKTTLKLQLAAAVAAGRPWLGKTPETGAALFISAEDELDELHRRLDAIAISLDITMSDLGDVHLVPLAGRDAVMGAPQDKSGIVAATPVFRGLVALAKRLRPRLIVIDALADVFGGEENARAQARQFVGLLRGLAIDHNLAVILIAHPSLTGISNGSGTSGSTAWSNSVRSRLYLERIKGDNGREIDPDLRLLSVKKSNYGPAGVEMRVRWSKGAFVLDGASGSFNKLAADANADRVFLDLLSKFTDQGRAVTDTPGHNYAPSEFAGAEGLSKDALKHAMKRLLLAGRLRVETFGPPSRQRKRIVTEPSKEDSE